MATIEDQQVLDMPRLEIVLAKSNKGADLYDVFVVHTSADEELPIATLLASGLTDLFAVDKIGDAWQTILDHCVDPKTLD